jgi:hypothetical protein
MSNDEIGSAMAKSPKHEPEAETDTGGEKRPLCGVIMPISAMPPEYDASHWVDVRRVLDEAICKADMHPQMVSDSFESDVIQRRIVRNLYNNPVVVCDVSGLNPNVMFELGMRITFKMPVVIITDDVQRIPFDTSVIEHLPYPRDLHIHMTNEFIESLADKIKTLHDQVKTGKFKSFIEAFGTFEVLQPTTETVSTDKYLAERMDEIGRSMRRLESRLTSGDWEPRSQTRSNALLSSSKLPGRRYKFIVPPGVESTTLSRHLIDIPSIYEVETEVVSDGTMYYIRAADDASTHEHLKRLFRNARAQAAAAGNSTG